MKEVVGAPYRISRAVLLARRLLQKNSTEVVIQQQGEANLLALALTLEQQGQLKYARRLVAFLRRARRFADGTWPSGQLDVTLAVLHARYTYQDPELPADSRLDRALRILEQIGPLSSAQHVEIFDTVGAIYKRKWFLDGHSEHLEVALAWYLRSYQAQQNEPGVPADVGYAWINAAFVLDQLASKEEEFTSAAGLPPVGAKARREEAAKIRTALVQRMLRSDTGVRRWIDMAGPMVRWAYYSNLGEAFLGLERHARARKCLRMARLVVQEHPDQVPSTHCEMAVRHLVHIVRMRHPGLTAEELTASEAGRVLEEFVGERDAVRGLLRGKVGLALSGGGFRASFFHIGVLASLAEKDMLRHVEVLSCVSGGSIVGAYYYLKLRQLLETGQKLNASDYVRIVGEIHTEFLARVQQNIRARALAEFSTCLRLIFKPYHTRTRRVGELLEEYVFGFVPEQGARRLRKLTINVPGEPTFNPKSHNWRRWDKVPILLLNATTLNTGHNWQFAATWMGEPPNETDAEIDCNWRLRRLYYREAPDPALRDLTLGQAVAASACVPGIFEPLALPRLYREGRDQPPSRRLSLRQTLAIYLRSRSRARSRSRLQTAMEAQAPLVTRQHITARLVDGGVHDNQGISSLLEQNCSVLIVSDASGQMSAEARPSTDPLGVLSRANKILMARVRSAQYQDLRARSRAGLIGSFMFLHLKKGLAGDVLDWVGCREPRDDESSEEASGDLPVTPYGINREVQELLARIRTDLDSFSETEACALMYSGYAMANHEWREHFGYLQEKQDGPGAIGLDAPYPWMFRRLEPLMSGSPEDPQYVRFKRLLALGSHRMLKVWRDPSVEAIAAAFLCVLITVLAIAIGVSAYGALMAVSPKASLMGFGWWESPLHGTTLGSLGVVLGICAFLAGLIRWAIYGERISQIAAGMLHGAMGLVAIPWVRLHLHVFHLIFVRRGALEHLLRPHPESWRSIFARVLRVRRQT